MTSQRVNHPENALPRAHLTIEFFRMKLLYIKKFPNAYPIWNYLLGK